MSEQFANLASTTLASAYTVGSGSISVMSAAGFPTSGTFTLVIRDQASKAIKLLFRVTSVSGTTFSGASEGTDAAANSGDLVDGTMVSVAMIAQLKADILASVPPNTNPFIYNLTAPVAANFTQKNFNVGSGVVSTQINLSSPITAITLIQHDSGQNQMIALAKAKLAATFTITLGFTASFPFGSNAVGGLFLTDNGGGPNIIHWSPIQPGFGGRCSIFSSYTGFSADIFGPQGQPTSVGPLFWMRIQETASARIYSVSSDGVNFAQVFTESNTAHFTTVQYGWALANRSGGANALEAMMTAYHFTETNP